MGTNRVIKTDNEIDVEGSNINLKATTDITGDCNISSNLTASGTVQGFTFPSDGTSGQILSTNGSGALSFIDAASGGDVDEITSPTDATNYTGTARIIHITSNIGVTFTNTNITDRIIFCSKNSSVTFETENFERNLVYTKSIVKIKSPHTAPSASIFSGVDTQVKNCSIFCSEFQVFVGSVFDSETSSNSGLNFIITNTSVNTNNSFIFDYNTTNLGTHKNFSCHFTSRILTNSTNTVSGAVQCEDSFIYSGNITNSFKFTDSRAVITHGAGGGVTSAKIIIGSTEYISGSIPIGFEVLGDQVKANVIAQAHNATSQACSGDATVVFGDTSSNTYIDNTSSLDSNGKFTTPVKGLYHVRSTIHASGAGTTFPTSILFFAAIKVQSNIVYSVRPKEVQFESSNVVFHLDCIVSLDEGNDVEISIGSTDSSYSLFVTANDGPKSTFSINKIN